MSGESRVNFDAMSNGDISDTMSSGDLSDTMSNGNLSNESAWPGSWFSCQVWIRTVKPMSVPGCGGGEFSR